MSGANVFTVEDTAAALGALANRWRHVLGAKVIGVTGSVGKTSVKEALFHALDRGVPGKAHRSLKSYNNHVGVPLSLARMPRDTSFGVFEMGMNHAGELAALTRLVRPHVAIVTAIALAHGAFFADEAAIADAKADLTAHTLAIGSFTATNLLAKHDEKYMPPEMAGKMHETKTLAK